LLVWLSGFSGIWLKPFDKKIYGAEKDLAISFFHKCIFFKLHHTIAHR